jgi:hypothetical protein
MIRNLGMNPAQPLNKRSTCEDVATTKNQADFENRQLTIPREQLKELIRQEGAV